MENVLLITFEDPKSAYDAIDELRHLSDERVLDVKVAALVERHPDGRFSLVDEVDGIGFKGTAVGGAVGALVGVLAGPVGALFGGAIGLAVGSLSDEDEVDTAQVLLATVSRRVPVGTTAVVAEAAEPVPEVVDALMATIAGTVHRWSRREVEDELAAADDAYRAAEREAQRVLRERRKAAGNETLRDRVTALQDKVTGRR